MVLQFPLFADYSYIYDDGRILFLTHGHLFNKENCPPLNKGDVFLSGHTHIPVFEEENEVYFVNPGSVSMPKNGSCNSYVIYEDKEFLFKDLDGNIYSKKRIQI